MQPPQALTTAPSRPTASQPPLRPTPLQRTPSASARILHPLNTSRYNHDVAFSASCEGLIATNSPSSTLAPSFPGNRSSTGSSLFIEGPRLSLMDARRLSVPSQAGAASFDGALPMQGRTPPAPAHTWLDRGSGEMLGMVDLEAGAAPRHNTDAASDDAEGADDADDSWNERHPCFPHRNPHVPPDAPEFDSTRVIRVARDYMFSGDVSPAFSNVYPEILEPFVSEDRFRTVVRDVNEKLLIAHSPWGVRNIVDGVVGCLTLWVYEDVIDTAAKKRFVEVEAYLEAVNDELAKEGAGARFIPLRRTGYLTVGVSGGARGGLR